MQRRGLEGLVAFFCVAADGVHAPGLCWASAFWRCEVVCDPYAMRCHPGPLRLAHQESSKGSYSFLLIIVVFLSFFSPGGHRDSFICSQPSGHTARSSRGCGRCGPCPWRRCRRLMLSRRTERIASSEAPRWRRRVVEKSPCCVCSRRQLMR